jgi:hypothetical protein
MKSLLKNIFIPGSVAVVMLTACSKILDQKPINSFLPQDGNADIAEASNTAIYSYLRVQWGEGMLQLGELPGDNCTATVGSVTNDAETFLDDFTWTPTSKYIDHDNLVYQSAYQAINACNSIIANVPLYDMDATRRDQIVGESYFLRAFEYFYLVRLFGGVPLYTQAILSGDPETIKENTQAPRASVDSVYVQILSDLGQAENLVAVSQSDASLNHVRPVRATVNALQAKVYLYLRDYAKAKEAAQKVISSGLYTFSSNFDDLWPAESKSESIFEIRYDDTKETGNYISDEVLPYPLATYSFPKFPRPTADFIEHVADTAHDLRFKYRGPIVKDGVYAADSYSSFCIGKGVGGDPDKGYFIYKWRNVNNGGFADPDNNEVLRLADIKLIYAEAENELNGPAQAFDQLNDIRTRAGLTALSITDLPDKQSFRDEVDRQRRLELAFEGERWFDLVRYAQDEQAGISHQITALDIIQQVRGTADERYLLFPIPQSEINSNPNLKQNPGF